MLREQFYIVYFLSQIYGKSYDRVRLHCLEKAQYSIKHSFMNV